MAVETSRTFSIDPDDGNPPARLHVRLLGGFKVAVDRRDVPETAWRQRRAASVVKLLAVEPSHRLHREKLMDLLWPELDYPAQLNNLRQALHHARRALESAGMPPGLALQRDGDVVVLAPAGHVLVDAHAFAAAVTDAWQSLTLARVEAALSLYGGDLLPDDPYDEWAEQPRTTLRASYLALLARLSSLYEEYGEPIEAVGAWQRLVAAECTNEAAHVALMRLYAGSGQRQHALAQFDRLVTILERELDASPQPETCDLAAEIREGRFQAPNQPEAAQHNIPSPISRLVGREEEVAELRQLLSTAPLLTLTGPGGIGKTRLAIEVARQLANRFPDGIVFIDLTPVRDPGRVIPAIAEALSVRESAGGALEATLMTALRGRQLLLVIDNFEQVAEAGQSIASLLEQASSVRVLVTSRVALRLRGEREYPVRPLEASEADSPAVRLFASRAGDVQPDFSLTDETATTVIEICRRLDGLPLAIELAAARSRVLSPASILERLNQPLRLLAAGASDLPDRQRTIRSTIQWSYDLLDPAEQVVFASLSVFVGGWTLDAAEVVGSDPACPIDIIDGLDSLAGKSLITRRSQADGNIRFGMLETIREFGLERLRASGQETIVRDRHAAWVVQLVEQAAPHIESAEQVIWLARLQREIENIRSGLDWLREVRQVEPALRMVPVLRLHWFGRGLAREGLEYALSITGLPEANSYPALRADALTAASFLARELGDYEQTYDVTRASLEISHQIHDRKRAADALVTLGFIALQRGQISDARSIAQRSLTIYQDLKNDQGIADSLGFLALTDAQLGDLETAGQRLEACCAIWSRLNDAQGVAWANAQLGLVRLDQADYWAAWDALMTSLDLSASIDFRGDVYLVFEGLSRLALAFEQPGLASELATAAVSVREQSGIRLSAKDQERSDQLLAELRGRLSADEFERAWIHRHAWSLDGIQRMTVDGLGAAISRTRLT